MKKLSILLSLFLFLATTLPVAAAKQNTTQPLGTFGFWRAYQVTDGGQPVCYMSLTGKAPAPVPQKIKKGKQPATKRGDVVLMVTHRPAEGSTDVVSYSAGTKFKPSSDAVIKIGAKEFNLFTQNDTAWSRDPATDHALAAAIRNATSLTMTGESAKEEKLADTVSLKGSLAAYKAISKACGVPFAEAKPHKNQTEKPKTIAGKPTTKLTPKKTPAASGKR